MILVAPRSEGRGADFNAGYDPNELISNHKIAISRYINNTYATHLWKNNSLIKAFSIIFADCFNYFIKR